jgi:hypothetical protein
VASGQLTIGEVHTGLLQHSSAAPTDLVNSLLAFNEGEHVWSVCRPIDYARSPQTLTGVDCLLPTSNQSKVRAIGTALSRAAITGRQVVQGTAYTTVEFAEARDRQPWEYYLSRRGIVETIGRSDMSTVADGFLGREAEKGYLNLGAVGQLALDRVLSGRGLDRRPPFKTMRGRLRFVIGGAARGSDPGADDGQAQTVMFGMDDEKQRRVRLPRRGAAVADVVDLCEDLALHDFLLTTLVDEVERGLTAAGTRRQAAAALAPVLHHLVHLWMPAARVKDDLSDIWQALEHRPALSRQWQAAVNRVRDHVALAALEPS